MWILYHPSDWGWISICSSMSYLFSNKKEYLNAYYYKSPSTFKLLQLLDSRHIPSLVDSKKKHALMVTVSLCHIFFFLNAWIFFAFNNSFLLFINYWYYTCIWTNCVSGVCAYWVYSCAVNWELSNRRSGDSRPPPLF